MTDYTETKSCLHFKIIQRTCVNRITALAEDDSSSLATTMTFTTTSNAAFLHTSKYFPWELTWPDTIIIKDLSWHFSADICKEKQMHASWSFLVGRHILEKKCYLYELYVPECLQDPNCVHSMLSWCCCSDRIQTDPYQAHLHKLL